MQLPQQNQRQDHHHSYAAEEAMAASSGGSLWRPPLPSYPMEWELPWEEESKKEEEEKEKEEKKRMRLRGMKVEESKKEEESKEEEEEELPGEEYVVKLPSLKQHVYPILHTAKAIQKDNPRVAYICRFTAYQVTERIPDPSGELQQFQTRLLYKLEKDEKKAWRRLAETDIQEIQKFCEQYCRKVFGESFQKEKPEKKIARHQMIANVLYDVLTFLTPENLPEFSEYAKGFQKVKVYTKEFQKEKVSSHYNILPLNTSEAVMEIPEIKAATELILRKTYKLPKPRTDPTLASEKIDAPDLFDWLRQTFGFQKDNVENQKEHLILLLANIDMRKRGERHQSETRIQVPSKEAEEIHIQMIHNDTITSLMKKVFDNYICWCRYLNLDPNIKIPRGASTQQPELLYIGLYLLIWGEASNVRFMPECLCYIFHHMAKYLYDLISIKREDSFDPPFGQEGSDDSFLHVVIKPIFSVMQKEAAMSTCDTTSHSKWRNYDDLNEYFWSKKCFKHLKWPMDLTADFFTSPTKSKNEREDHVVTRWRMTKTNFVELRTFFLLFRSFHRMWSFLILAFQAMVIIAWSPCGCISSIFEPSIFRNLMTIFITDAFLNFFQDTLEIVLVWKAWRSLECTQMIRYILKFTMALAWLIILPTIYINCVLNSTYNVKFFSNWIGTLRSASIYNYAVTLYMLPNLISSLFFIFLQFRRKLEYSNSRIVRTFLWWSQPKLYIAQGMYDDTSSFLKYMLFWFVLLMCKLAFSFYVEISPLVGLSREIMFLGWETYEHMSFSYLQPKFGVLLTVWAPVTMVYFMDTQIWYSIFSTVCGGMSGVLSSLGEVQSLSMLRSRFKAIPRAFEKNLVPRHCSQSKKSESEDGENNYNFEFSNTWNALIVSLQEEDLISNRERLLLTFPSPMGETTVFQWPLFLIANKIQYAVDMVISFKGKDEELIKRIKEDIYTYDAVKECYETLLNILYGLMNEPSNKKAVDNIRVAIENNIRRQSFLKEFRLDEIRLLIQKFDKLLNLVRVYDYYHSGNMEVQVINLLGDILEVLTKDFMKNGQWILKQDVNIHNINLDCIKGKAWGEKCIRLQLLLTTRESAIDIPTNLEARRRILFFANSLFMKMPRAPHVQRMMSFSVLTPCFKEKVLFSEEDLWEKNEHGMDLVFYLRKVYRDEFRNFLERIDFKPIDEEEIKEKMDEICLWASYRGQTLSRTVRGMMYYRRALEIQCVKDKVDLDKFDSDKLVESTREARAIADIKFTYVVSYQIHGMEQKNKDFKDRVCNVNILNLMTRYPSLRVAYIDEVEDRNGNGMREKTYYSVLVKGAGYKEYEVESESGSDFPKFIHEIYRIKLPGKPTEIGEWKPETQNHAIIFTRGEALQAIDINQDNYLEEAFKMRNLLEEFESEKCGQSKPTILGLREHILPGSLSSPSLLISNQEASFVTIGQRLQANPLKVRFHYGHSDIFDRLFHITRGGISKASKTLNRSEGIFSGFNSIMRGGTITYHEYMQVGKTLDGDGINQISRFEANAACGNGEQTLSRDIYRLGHRFDFYRMLSLYFTTVGFYFSSMVSVLTVYVFLYGKLYLAMSGLEQSIFLDQHTQKKMKPLESALGSQSVFQLGFLIVLPILIEFALEKDFPAALGQFIIMQLQLAPVLFTQQLGTRFHYYTRTILHGGATGKRTDHGLVPLYRVKFAENYRMYSRSHFVKGLELFMLLCMCQLYGSYSRTSILYQFVMFSIWFLISSWLFAPFIFNPSCFEWQLVAEEWADWRIWMENKGGFGISVEQSWEDWWESEQEHLRKTSSCALLLEFILSFRFLIYHCGIMYYVYIAHPSQSTLVYGLSWLLMLSVLVVQKADSIGQQRFATDLQLMIRILKALIFLGSVLVMSVLFVLAKVAIADVFISILGLIPIGWFILLIGQVCSPFLKKTMLWDTIVDLARAYDNMMGLIIFCPIVILSYNPFISEIHTQLVFFLATGRGIDVSRILAGRTSSYVC